VITLEVRNNDPSDGRLTRTPGAYRCFLPVRSLSRLSLPPFLMLVLFAFAPARVICQQVEKQTSQQPLEVRVTEPSWDKGCLKFSVDRINHASTSLYLSGMGPYISLAVKDEAPETGNSQDARWVNIYGLTESVSVSWEAAPIAPGATVHNDYCFRAAVAVVNPTKETRREIPLRGQLREEAFYFLSEEDWKKDKHYHEEMFSEHSKPRKRPKFPKTESTTAYVEIPCHEVGCNAECEKPPIVLPDEQRILPDFFSFDAKANARGNAISNKLARKFPACAEDAQPTN
jgi:hypothetical protein